MKELLNDQTFVWGVISMITFLITQGLKWAFVKPYTKNLNKRAKTLINSVILIIAFGSAILCEYLYSNFWLHTEINFDRAYYSWGGASGLYGLFELIIKVIKGEDVKLENPFETEEGTKVKEAIGKAVKSKKENAKDSDILKEFVEDLKK